MSWADVLRCDPCAYCGETGGSVDHIDPVSLSGSDEPANLTGACRSCNSSKGQASPLLFLARGRGSPKPTPGPFYLAVGRNVLYARRTRGWSARVLALRAGVSQATIYRWENGHGVTGALPVLAKAFGTNDWNWLLREAAA